MALLCLLAMLGQSPGFEQPTSPSLLSAEPNQVRRMGFDLMVGSPLGLALRLQRRFDDAPYYVEGSFGTFLFGGGVGVGLRREFANEIGRCDSLVARPGVSAYYISLSDFVSDRRGVGVLAVDVDFAWQHRYFWGGIGELGLKVGPGFILGRDAQPLAILGVYHGWRF